MQRRNERLKLEEKLTPENIVDPENSHLFAAMGAALEAENTKALNLDDLISRLDRGVDMEFELKRLDPLFENEEEYKEFLKRHEAAVVKKEDISTYSGDCFLGIDAGVESLDAQALAKAFKVGLASMRDVVKGDVGDKTCFDALIPAINAMEGKNSVAEVLEASAKASDEGAKNTVNLQAKFGRARNLGEKSIGTLDPGAVSNAMIFAEFYKAFIA